MGGVQKQGSGRAQPAGIARGGIGGGPLGDVGEPGVTVAGGQIGGRREGVRVHQRGSQGAFGLVSQARVAEAESGQLLGSGDAGSAVAPARPLRRERPALRASQVRRRGPVRPGVAVAPALQPGQDGANCLTLAVDLDAAPQRESKERERPGDPVGEAAVGVPAGEPLVPRAGRAVERPPTRPDLPVVLDILGQADQAGQDSPDGLNAGGPTQQDRADAGQPPDRVELGECRQVAALDPGFGLLAAT